MTGGGGAIGYLTTKLRWGGPIIGRPLFFRQGEKIMGSVLLRRPLSFFHYYHLQFKSPDAAYHCAKQQHVGVGRRKNRYPLWWGID